MLQISYKYAILQILAIIVVFMQMFFYCIILYINMYTVLCSNILIQKDDNMRNEYIFLSLTLLIKDNNYILYKEDKTLHLSCLRLFVNYVILV